MNGGDEVLSGIRFTAASSRDRETGIVGWLSGQVAGGLRVDGIALRRTLDGRLTLSFPERTDAQGRRHPLIRPVDDAARRRFEASVFEALGFEEDIAP